MREKEKTGIGKRRRWGREVVKNEDEMVGKRRSKGHKLSRKKMKGWEKKEIEKRRWEERI